VAAELETKFKRDFIKGKQNGFELFEIIREFSKSPVIFITGNKSRLLMNLKFEKEITIIDKPVNLSALLDTIKSLF